MKSGLFTLAIFVFVFSSSASFSSPKEECMKKAKEDQKAGHQACGKKQGDDRRKCEKETNDSFKKAREACKK